MHPIVTEILAAGKGLSPGALGVAIGLGLLLWLTGWRWHRFWVVVSITIGGGIYGLMTGNNNTGQMLAMALLLALCAGLLAMELTRIFSFLAAGTSLWMGASLFIPKGQELWFFFLAGGLGGIIFFRMWMMSFTSTIGTLIMGHAGLLLWESFTKFDIVGWTERNNLLVVVLVPLISLIGMTLQSAQVRWTKKESKGKPKRKRLKRPAAEPEEVLPKDVKALRDAFVKREDKS